MNQVSLTVFVEGGGDNKALKASCRAGFTRFVKKAGLEGYMPRIEAKGSRNNALDAYKTALEEGTAALLLVDSEIPVDSSCQPKHNASGGYPWEHLKKSDNWDKPNGAEDDDCHLMVQCMESWFIADMESLAGYYGNGFNKSALPKDNRSIEDIDKNELLDAILRRSTKDSKKGRYSKSNHSFDVLGQIDPEKVINASPWAKRFINTVKQRMGVS